MEVSPETLVAVGGLATGLFSLVSSQIVARRSARKDEVKRLQERIDKLIDEVEMWRTRYGNLFNYMLMLRTILINAGLEVPDLSEDSGKTDEDGNVEKLTMPKKVKRVINRWKGIVPPEHLPLPSESKKTIDSKEEEDKKEEG